MPAMEVLHAGNRELFTAALPALGAHLLRHGALGLRVESRFVTAPPPGASLRPMGVPKYYRSATLPPADVSTLYSERVILLL